MVYLIYVDRKNLYQYYANTRKLKPIFFFQVKEWLKMWDISIEQKRTCYRELHTALKDEHKR